MVYEIDFCVLGWVGLEWKFNQSPVLVIFFSAISYIMEKFCHSENSEVLHANFHGSHLLQVHVLRAYLALL